MVCVAVCSEDVVQVMNCGLCCCVFRECGTCDELWSAGVDVCSEGVVQVINCGLCCCVFRGAVKVQAEEPQPTGRSEVVEEQTQYRGVRNSSTQSRSFRIITDSLVEEMNCESPSSPPLNVIFV